MVIEEAKEVLRIEAQSILALVERIDRKFEDTVDMILESKGRVILTGMGKSGLIARKISATLNSTGTPSLFLHPAEAIHGDLGMVTPDDVVLAISNSGQTSEINRILPMLKSTGVKAVAFTGGLNSPMAELCDIVIDVCVEKEACPMGIAPTASTTASLAMGDALAVALMNRRHFNKEDFKKFHPGGTLGERLSTNVKEVMLTGDSIPAVFRETTMKEVLLEIDKKRVGATLVVRKDNSVIGIITDGDVRRTICERDEIYDLKAEDIMSQSPKTILEDQTAAEALALMELNAITHLVVIDHQKKLKGLAHLHDILGREEFRLNGGFKVTMTTRHPE
ncbi:SIS domain-containing protein [Thermodesulfobacteriota bacterium]